MKSIGLLMTVVLWVFFLTSCTTLDTQIWEFDTPAEQLRHARIQQEALKYSFTKEKTRNQMKKTIIAYKKVIEKFPEDMEFTPHAFIGLGNTYLMKDEPKKAMTYLKTALTHYPENEAIQAVSLFGIGYCYLKMEDYQNAQSIFSQWLEKYSNSDDEAIKAMSEQCARMYHQARTKL